MLSGSNTKIKVAALLIAFLTFLIFLPALQYDFVNWDDHVNVYENSAITSLDSNFLEYMFSFKDTMWIPMTRLSHALDYAAWGLDPMGHHLTNIVLHGFNTFLVVILIFCLIKTTRPANRSATSDNENTFLQNTLIAACLTGILFGIHPLRVESVVWVTERKDVLSGFFILLCLLSYLKFSLIALKKERWVYYAFSIILFIMALMSKPIVVTLPVVLVILDIYPLERLTRKSGLKTYIKVLAEKIPFFALSLTLSMVTLLSYKSEGIIVTLRSHVNLIDKIFIALKSICFYLGKILWPVDLVPFYSYPSKIDLLTPEYTGSLIVVSGITAFCIFSWKKQKVWSVVWVYFIVTLLPVLGIMRFGNFVAADRYTYLPSLGPTVLVSLGIVFIYRSISKKHTANVFLLFISIFLAALLSILTIQQAGIWKDSIALWNHQIKIYPDSYNGNKNLANAYARDERIADAINSLNRAGEINPKDPAIYYNRGIGYGKIGQHQKAIEDLKKAIELAPQEAKYYYELGVAHGSLGNYRQAIENLNRSIKLDPQFTNAYFYRGIAYKSLDNDQFFIRDLQIAAQQGHKKAQDYLLSIGMEW
ncbi:lipoprotein NlpI [bacterium BMS3Abin09]|nr:lipoprotein NlpI [bacterium BMS3Abin09]